MTVIEWSAPAAAKQDWLMGAGATRAERALMWLGSMVGLGFVAWQWAVGQPGGWTWWQYLIAALIAADLAGGAVSNAASSTKRQYFGPPTTIPGPLTRVLRSPTWFAALHLYPFIVAAVYPDAGWAWAAANYLAMLACVVVVDRLVPAYLQRPTAMLLFTALVLASSTWEATPPGWAWFPAVYLAKLLLAHAVLEEPYRPAPGT